MDVWWYCPAELAGKNVSMQTSGVYKAADEGVQGTQDAPFPVTLQPVVE